MSDNVHSLTVVQLLKELKDLDDWFLLGVYLGVPVKKLQKIESSHHQRQLERCKVDMLQFWLDSNVSASWKDVIRALEQTNQLVLAATMKRKYMYLLSTIDDKGEGRSANQFAEERNTSQTQLSTSFSPSPSPPLTVEEIEAEIKADTDVMKELQDLQTSFCCTLVKIKRYLENNCELSDAKLFLDIFTETQNFRSCNNFEELIRRLEQDHVDTFNTAGLKGLVDCFERDELKEIFEGYEEKKRQFLKNTTVLNFQRAVVSKVESVLPSGKAVLTVKISKELASKRTLKDIEDLAKEGLEDHHKSLIQLNAKPGSIVLSWIYPEALSGKLEQLAHNNAAIFKDAGVEEVTVGGRRVYPITEQEDFPLTDSQDVKKKSTVKQVYTEFYHQLVDAISDPHTSQALTAQLHSTTLLSQEKIAQLSYGQTSGREFLKVLGVEEEPHLLTVLMEKMAGVKQLQTLAELMTARLSELQQEAEYTSKSTQQDTIERFKAKNDELTNETKELLMRLQHCEKELEKAKKLFQEDSLSVHLMAQKTKREMAMQKRISELEEKLQSYGVADVQQATTEDGVHKRDASVTDEEVEEITLPQHEGYNHTTTVQVATEEGGHKRDTDVMEKASMEEVEEEQKEKAKKNKEEEQEEKAKEKKEEEQEEKVKDGEEEQEEKAKEKEDEEQEEKEAEEQEQEAEEQEKEDEEQEEKAKEEDEEQEEKAKEKEEQEEKAKDEEEEQEEKTKKKEDEELEEKEAEEQEKEAEEQEEKAKEEDEEQEEEAKEEDEEQEEKAKEEDEEQGKKANEEDEEEEEQEKAKEKEEEEEKAEVTLPQHEGYSDTAVQTKKDLEPLPVGWETHVTPQGHNVFVDHNTHSTQWEDPRIPELHQTPSPHSHPLPSYDSLVTTKVVTEIYSSDFEDIKERFFQLFGEVAGILEKEESVTLNKLKRLLFKFPEIKTSLDSTSTISDAVILIQEHSSITCCSYLKRVATLLNIPAAVEKIDSYYKCMEEFCRKKLTRHIYMKPFIIGKSVTFTPYTTITFKLQWNPKKRTLSDVKSIIRVAFHDHSTDVHIVMVREGTVRVLCYSPQHVMKRLVRLAQANKEELVGSGVTYFRAGVTIVVDNMEQSEMVLVEGLILQLNSSLHLKDFYYTLMSKHDSHAKDVVRKSDISHSSDVSEGATGVVHSNSQSDPTTKSKEVGAIITQNQAEHLLSGKPNGTFILREMDGSARDPSLTAINTHDISVVVKGKILHFAIYKRGKFYATLNNEKFSSIKHMIGYYSRIGFQTEEGILVKLTDQLIPDKETLASLPSYPIIYYYSFRDVASLPKHFPHHDERTWLCPLLSRRESLILLKSRQDETFLVRATELSEPNHVYTLDVMVKREFMFMYIFKRGAWLQLESISDRYDSINTLVMSLATSTLSFTVDGQEILARLRYPVYT